MPAASASLFHIPPLPQGKPGDLPAHRRLPETDLPWTDRSAGNPVFRCCPQGTSAKAWSLPVLSGDRCPEVFRQLLQTVPRPDHPLWAQPADSHPRGCRTRSTPQGRRDLPEYHRPAAPLFHPERKAGSSHSGFLPHPPEKQYLHLRRPAERRPRYAPGMSALRGNGHRPARPAQPGKPLCAVRHSGRPECGSRHPPLAYCCASSARDSSAVYVLPQRAHTTCVPEVTDPVPGPGGYRRHGASLSSSAGQTQPKRKYPKRPQNSQRLRKYLMLPYFFRFHISSESGTRLCALHPTSHRQNTGREREVWRRFSFFPRGRSSPPRPWASGLCCGRHTRVHAGRNRPGPSAPVYCFRAAGSEGSPEPYPRPRSRSQDCCSRSHTDGAGNSSAPRSRAHIPLPDPEASRQCASHRSGGRSRAGT